MSVSPTEISFLQRLIDERAITRSAGRAALMFAHHHGIGIQVGRAIEYNAHDYCNARLFLQTHNIPLHALAPDSPRAQTMHSGQSEKIGTRAPHADSVMVKPLSGRCLLDGHLLWARRGGYYVMTTEDARRIESTALLAVENLETFRYIEDYTWIDCHGENVLAIYRGDNRYGINDFLNVITDHPHLWWFGDFDPAGLHMAIDLGKKANLCRVIHPDLHWLEMHARGDSRGESLYGKSLAQYQSILNSAPDSDVDSLWQLMKRIQAGWPQEWMTNISPAPANGVTS